MAAGSRRIGPLAVAAVAALAGTLALAAPAGATFPGDNGRVVLGTDTYPGPPGYTTVNPDGSDERFTKIDGLSGYALHVAWSPDGARIAFTADSGERPPGVFDDFYPWEIFTANADGSGLRRISTDRYPNHGAAWSPDGRSLAYGVDTMSGRVKLVVSDADGQNPHELAGTFDSLNFEWSRDGSEILYSEPFGMRAISPAGGAPRTIATFGDPLYLRTFSLSPDGRSVVYELNGPAGCGGQCQEIWRMNIDGTGRQRLVAAGGSGSSDYVGAPVWSPDGTTIAFCRWFSFDQAASGRWHIDPDGSNPRRVAAHVCGGDWQPLPRQAPPTPAPGGGPAPDPGGPTAPPAPTPPPPGPCGTEQLGSARADRLVGTAGGDRLVGGAGHDVLAGLAGIDCLLGGAGNDRLSGGDGDDRLEGSAGLDALSGGRGDDVLSGGSGRDRLEGGPGSDVLRGGPAYDVVRGGAGDDRVDVRGGQPDTVDCGPGRDLARVSRSDRVRNCERVTVAR
jgi:hypothetical protein